ncbi:hypothetical protein K458DRAFT_395666 [Lentithecium fluviatile CBS 122367]|uniref:Uncharacterized protein n=1 Tax=Lentithecium fluviatile CBS 122367 TaxID=1168545 RepID=A0A6G1IHN8_9PLEO|nr:hypothetical protein K458DRAFT_395666 [Lentithecium fluviatile CBS 122367]
MISRNPWTASTEITLGHAAALPPTVTASAPTAGATQKRKRLPTDDGSFTRDIYDAGINSHHNQLKKAKPNDYYLNHHICFANSTPTKVEATTINVSALNEGKRPTMKRRGSTLSHGMLARPDIPPVSNGGQAASGDHGNAGCGKIRSFCTAVKQRLSEWVAQRFLFCIAEEMEDHNVDMEI